MYNNVWSTILKRAISIYPVHLTDFLQSVILWPVCFRCRHRRWGWEVWCNVTPSSLRSCRQRICVVYIFRVYISIILYRWHNIIIITTLSESNRRNRSFWPRSWPLSPVLYTSVLLGFRVGNIIYYYYKILLKIKELRQCVSRYYCAAAVYNVYTYNRYIIYMCIVCVEETHACAHFCRRRWRRLRKTITIGAHTSSPNPNARDWPCVLECTTVRVYLCVYYIIIICVHYYIIVIIIRLCCYKRGSKDGKQVKQKPHRRRMIRRCETYILYI